MIRFFMCILMVWFTGGIAVHAQTRPLVVPKPQQASFSEETISLKELYKLGGSMSPSNPSMKVLKGYFNLSQNAAAKPLNINHVIPNSRDQQVSGYYHLQIENSEITIGAFDQRGLFYALQTLAQLVDTTGGDRRVPLATVTDYPLVNHRGVVEGFYGEPWTHEDRLRQMDFYGKFKLNTYIYGPKDDPYHSSPNWRKPYPPQEEERIKELVDAANKNYVDFYWAIHPGKDIEWTAADSLAVIIKFEWMYQLGVRNFAVFFDDISGVGTDARKQAALLNYIDEAFMKPKKDAGFLILCPTEYNKAWSNKEPGTYLDILGNRLRPHIEVMWTGDRVIADNTVKGLQWINDRINRKAFVWWNFPVSDYVRDHLLMGPAYGLEKGAAPHMSGFVSNPMDKAEASKVALIGVSWYAWNTPSYDAQVAWEYATNYLMPQAPALFRVFNEHNSDLGPNGHGYRRAESERIAPVIESFMATLRNNKIKADDFQQIRALFDSIALAAEQIPLKARNKRLIEQISPWLQQFAYLGTAGQAALNMVESNAAKNKAEMWQAFQKLDLYLDSIQYLDRHLNQNPYQPGVKTGSLVLMPFVKTLRERGRQILLTGKARDTATKKATTSALITDIEKLRRQPIQMTNKTIAISPVLESIAIENAASAGVHVPSHVNITGLDYHFQGQNVAEKIQIQGSADGTSWEQLSPLEKGGKGHVDLAGKNLRYVRFVNTSGRKLTLFLKQFQLLVEPVNDADAHFTLDGSLETFELATPEGLFIELPKNLQGQPLRILTTGEEPVEVRGYRKGFSRDREIFTGKSGYILLPAKQMRKIKNISIHSKAEPVKIVEVLLQKP